MYLTDIVNIAGAFFVILSIFEIPRLAKVIRNKKDSGQDSLATESCEKGNKFSRILRKAQIIAFDRLFALAIGAVFVMIIHDIYVAYRITPFEIMWWKYPLYIWIILLFTRTHLAKQWIKKGHLPFIILGTFLMALYSIFSKDLDSYYLFF